MCLEPTRITDAKQWWRYYEDCSDPEQLCFSNMDTKIEMAGSLAAALEQ